jgi:hypothetical protein
VTLPALPAICEGVGDFVYLRSPYKKNPTKEVLTDAANYHPKAGRSKAVSLRGVGKRLGGRVERARFGAKTR